MQGKSRYLPAVGGGAVPGAVQRPDLQAADWRWLSGARAPWKVAGVQPASSALPIHYSLRCVCRHIIDWHLCIDTDTSTCACT